MNHQLVLEILKKSNPNINVKILNDLDFNNSIIAGNVIKSENILFPQNIINEDETIDQLSRKHDKIDDYGEKIGGAKKDLYQKYTFALDNTLQLTDRELINKSTIEIYPKINFEAFAMEYPQFSSTILDLKYLYDNLEKKPRSSAYYYSKGSRWIEKTKFNLNQINTIIKFISGIDNVLGSDYSEAKELLEASLSDTSKYKLYTHIQKGLDFPSKKSEEFKYNRIIKQFDIYNYDLYNTIILRSYLDDEELNRTYRITPEENLSIDSAISLISDKIITNFNKATIQETPRINKKNKYPKYGVYRTSTKYLIGYKKYSNFIELKSFESLKSARDYLKNNQSELDEIHDKLTEQIFERNEENLERTGSPYRTTDVTVEEFATTFGLRAVEFGNWVNNSERQDRLNRCYDAFCDLAKILDIPLKGISLDGELAIAFGARGSSKAMAHYEPYKVVINLTKKNGAGSLAHEWFHALDNYLTKGGQKSVNNNFLSHIKRGNPSETRDVLVASINNIYETIKTKTELFERSRTLDKQKKEPYWSSLVEIGARTFESYIKSKLSSYNITNDFLVNIKEIEKYPDYKTDVYPYPLADEIQIINDEFENFFDILDTKITENNNVKLFRTIEINGQLEHTGYLQNDTIYLNEKHLDTNTIIHEYGHVWLNNQRENNTILYQKGIELIKSEGQEYIEIVKSNSFYNSLPEEKILNEALTLAIEDKGVKITKKGQTEFISFMEEMKKDILNKFIETNRVDAIDSISLDDFTNYSISDLFGKYEDIISLKEQTEVGINKNEWNSLNEIFNETIDQYSLEINQNNPLETLNDLEGKENSFYSSITLLSHKYFLKEPIVLAETVILNSALEEIVNNTSNPQIDLHNIIDKLLKNSIELNSSHLINKYTELKTNLNPLIQPTLNTINMKEDAEKNQTTDFNGNIDLFQDRDNIPQEIQIIIDKYNNIELDKGGLDYNDCEDFLKECQFEGYTFEYGLDAEPFNLRSMNNNDIELLKFDNFCKKVNDYFDEIEEPFINLNSESGKEYFKDIIKISKLSDTEYDAVINYLKIYPPYYPTIEDYRDDSYDRGESYYEKAKEKYDEIEVPKYEESLRASKEQLEQLAKIPDMLYDVELSDKNKELLAMGTTLRFADPNHSDEFMISFSLQEDGKIHVAHAHGEEHSLYPDHATFKTEKTNQESANNVVNNDIKEFYMNFNINYKAPLTHNDIYAFINQASFDKLKELLKRYKIENIPSSLYKKDIIANIVNPLKATLSNIPEFKKHLNQQAKIELKTKIETSFINDLKSNTNKSFEDTYYKYQRDKINVYTPITEVDINALLNHKNIPQNNLENLLLKYTGNNLKSDSTSEILNSIIRPIIEAGTSVEFKKELKDLYKTFPSENSNKDLTEKSVLNNNSKISDQDFFKLEYNTGMSINHLPFYNLALDKNISAEERMNLINYIYKDILENTDNFISSPEELESIYQPTLLKEIVYPLKNNPSKQQEAQLLICEKYNQSLLSEFKNNSDLESFLESNDMEQYSLSKINIFDIASILKTNESNLEIFQDYIKNIIAASDNILDTIKNNIKEFTIGLNHINESSEQIDLIKTILNNPQAIKQKI